MHFLEKTGEPSVQLDQRANLVFGKKLVDLCTKAVAKKTAIRPPRRSKKGKDNEITPGQWNKLLKGVQKKSGPRVVFGSMLVDMVRAHRGLDREDTMAPSRGFLNSGFDHRPVLPTPPLESHKEADGGCAARLRDLTTRKQRPKITRKDVDGIISLTTSQAITKTILAIGHMNKGSKEKIPDVYTTEVTSATHDDSQLVTNRRSSATGAELRICKGLPGSPCCVHMVEGGSIVNLGVFLLPREEMEFQTTGVIPEHARYCLLCIRRKVQEIAADASVNSSPPILINTQSVACFVDIIEGYKSSHCFLPTTRNGLTSAFTRFESAYLSVVQRNGALAIDQSMLKAVTTVPADFQRGVPSSGVDCHSC